jgi:hypothetical protein
MAVRVSRPDPDDPPREPLPKDESRLEMMRRQKSMTLEERLRIFESLSRDAVWALRAKRVR